MSVKDTQQECMGWCPCEQQMGGKMQKRPVVRMDDAAGGRNGRHAGEFSWFGRYHNQLLVSAFVTSAVGMLLVSLMGSNSDSVWTAITIGAGGTIYLWLSHSKQYTEVAGGKWRKGEVPARKRLFWSLMMLFLSVLSIICVTSWVVYQGRFDSLGMIVFGVAFIFWNSLIITVLWELWHQKVMIREGGSWYAVNPGMMDNGGKRGIL